MIKLYQLHPVAVHFPVALLTLGLAVEAMSRSARFSGKKPWLSEAASWLLWAGTLAAWAAVGLGQLAEELGPHVPPAWEVLEEHEELGVWTAGVFSALSLWRVFVPRLWPRLFVLAWAGAVILLIVTAQHGGELVYEFGMGLSPR